MNFGKFIRKYSTDTENENSPNRSSIISGTSKLFDSVNTKTTNLVSGLSNTFEQIKRRTSVESLSFTDKEAAKPEENDHKVRAISQHNSNISGFENTDTKLPYKDAKSYIEQANQFQERHPNEAEYSASIHKKNPPPKPPPPLNRQRSTPHDDDRSQSRETFSRSQTLVVERDYMDEIHQDEYIKIEGGQIANEVLEDAKSHLEMECQKIVSAMDDLISFDPICNLNQTVTGRNSSPSEYGDSGDQLIYGKKCMPEKQPLDASTDSGTEEINERQRDFMDAFVSDIYREGNTQVDEISMSEFRKCVQSQSGRGWFAKLVEKNQYLSSKEVPETIFYRLLQAFTVVLLECHEHGDFLPARDLMLVTFRCYAVLRTLSGKTTYNFYLSSFISCHPIWKSIQFWNVCFFNAVQEVRSKKAPTRRNSTNTTDADGVAFHQLQVHLNYMRSLGLPLELCSEFVRKQVDIVNLTDDEMRRLKEVMVSWKE